MDQIMKFVENINKVQFIDIIIAIGIIIFFRLLSNTFSYVIIKMFKFRTKEKKGIRNSAFYTPLSIFFRFLGFYLAIVFLRTPLNINNDVMLIVTKLFKIVVTISFAKGLASSLTMKSAFKNVMKEKLNREVEDSMVNFVLKVTKILIYTVAGFIVITELGFNLNGLVAGLGIGGVIVTLAAQDTAKNLFGGLVIVLDKPFVVGDWIQMDVYEGTVEDITFRSTRIRTFENSVVNVPNSIISNTSIINWSKMEKRRYKINLVVELDTPLEKLEHFKQRVYNMLQERESVFDDSIIVKFDDIKDSGINILICSYTDSVDYPSYLAEKENINYKIMKILKEEGINTAYDTKTIYMKKEF